MIDFRIVLDECTIEFNEETFDDAESTAWTLAQQESTSDTYTLEAWSGDAWTSVDEWESLPAAELDALYETLEDASSYDPNEMHRLVIIRKE